MTTRRAYYTARKFELARMRLDDLIAEGVSVLDMEGNGWASRNKLTSEGLRTYFIEVILETEFPEYSGK